MPARPVIAQLPDRSSTGNRVRYIALYEVPGILLEKVSYVGVAKEVNNNGTVAFYYGKTYISNCDSFKVLTVLNTK